MDICPKCGEQSLCVGNGMCGYYEGCDECGYEFKFNKEKLPEDYSCEKCGSKSGEILETMSEIRIRCLDCKNEIVAVHKRKNASAPPIASGGFCSNSPVSCPKCGSSQITTGARGFSIVWGFWGSNKTVNRCARCGHTWKPRG